MKYYVVSNDFINKAVVFHDMTAFTYIIRSKSEAFRRAFEASVRYINGVKLVREANKLNVVNVSLGSEYWMKSVLDRICTGHWVITASNYFDLDDSLEAIIEKYLN